MTEPTLPDLPQSGGSWVRQPDGSLTPSTPTEEPAPKPAPRGKSAPEKE